MGLFVFHQTRARDKPLSADTADVRPYRSVPHENMTLQIRNDVEAASARVTKERLRASMRHCMDQKVSFELVTFPAYLAYVWEPVDVRLLVSFQYTGRRKHLAALVTDV